MTPMISRDIRRLIDKALRRANGIVSRGVVKLTTDSGKGQTVGVTVRAGEDHDEVEHFQPFGFTSRVVGTAEALFFAIGGDRAHGIVTAVQDRARRFRGPSGAGLAPGESALYGADGQRVHCKKDGHVAAVPTGAGYVVLGADDASRFVAIAERVLEELQAVKSYLDGHSHAAGALLDGTAAPCTGTTGPPTSSAPTPQSVAATKVKAT